MHRTIVRFAPFIALISALGWMLGTAAVLSSTHSVSADLPSKGCASHQKKKVTT